MYKGRDDEEEDVSN